jgi:hypothetical protein
MSASLNQFEFISDPRDGRGFDVIKNLEAAVLRGSKLASETLVRLEYQVANTNTRVPHSKIESDLKGFEVRWEVIRAFEENEEGDEDEIEDQDDLIMEIAGWIENLGNIGIESYKFIFDKYINFEGCGSFGQGAGFSFDEDLWQLITDPLIPRDLLWEFSVGDSAECVKDPNGDGWSGPFLDMAPRYVNYLSISPVASTNLLKAINEKYCHNDPFHLHTMLNVNSDIWLLKDLDPKSVRDNLIFELHSIVDSSSPHFDDDFEEKYMWLLGPYFSTSSGVIEWKEAAEAMHNKFSNPHGCGALLIATRMSEEFKAGIVNIDDHLDSDSEIMRTLLYYNPDLAKDQKDSLKKLGIIELDKDVAELYKNAWKPNNPTMVM